MTKKRPYRSRATTFMLFALAGVLLGLPAAATASSFTTIDVPGAVRTFVFGINNHSVIVGSYYDAVGLSHGFRLEGSTFFAIDVPGASLTHAWGINDRGVIVGFYQNSGGVHGFVAR